VTGLVVQKLAEDAGYAVLSLSARKPRPGTSLYLSAGIHGDEPAGALGLLVWAETNLPLLASADILILPILNPHGLKTNTRHDAAGRDLNRSFHDPASSPIIQGWRELTAERRFDACLCLHEDYDARGCYLYELNRQPHELGTTILNASGLYIPVDPRRTIDGRRFSGSGILRRRKAPNMPEKPEAIALFEQHTDISLTFETPSEWSLWRRVQAHLAAIDAFTGHFLPA
jgi:hypothetical protein